MNLIEELTTAQTALLRGLPRHPPRKLFHNADWQDRLIGIIGAKGVGKTTIMLQRLALKENALYCSLDHPALLNCSLIGLATDFYMQGGECLYFDEVHKFENWAAHIKTIFDSLPSLKVVFSGSSALHLHKGRGDLSRRASIYHLPTLSFREFLQIQLGIKLPEFTLTEICNNHRKIAENLTKDLKPLKHFREYLQAGAYPFVFEGKTKYHSKLVAVVAQTIESDLVQINNLEGRNVNKLKKLLDVIASSVPFTPNMVSLSAALEISRPTLYQYLELLEQGKLIHLLRAKGRATATLNKAEKILLDNPNLSYALAPGRGQRGTERETFFVSQLRGAELRVEAARQGDFFVADTWTFEVGGKSKGIEQITGVKNGFIVSDEIEVGTDKRIPLWLFGFLY